MLFGGRSPPGPAGSLSVSTDPLAVAEEEVGLKEEKGKGLGKEKGEFPKVGAYYVDAKVDSVCCGCIMYADMLCRFQHFVVHLQKMLKMYRLNGNLFVG